MTRLPAWAAVDAAESRLVESRQAVRLSAQRTRSAVRTAIARPSTVALVALASGVSAFLVSQRIRPTVKNVAKRADSPTSAISESSPGLVQTLVSMYGAAAMTYLLQLGATAWKQHWARIQARVSTEMPGASVPNDSVTSEPGY